MILSSFVIDECELSSVSPDELDSLLAEGWRHAGTDFYRYSVSIYNEELTDVLPLRLRLGDFSFSKSQRRTLRRFEESGFWKVVRPTVVDAEKDVLFQSHKQKFSEDMPETLGSFLSEQAPHNTPCDCREISIYDGDKLIAASFFDVGAQSLSSIYGMYDLEYADFGLGILTMLLEIEYARSQEKTFYYHGYCYSCESYYDYKKRFRALDYYDWQGRWLPFENYS